MKTYNFDLPEGNYLDIKRFYFDGIIEHPCPCGGKLTRDFSEWYLSYPKIGEDINIILLCDTCNKYYSFEGRLEGMSIKLSLDPKSIKED